MDYSKFSYTSNNFIILREIKTEYPTESGKSWSRKGVEFEREIVSPENYTNYITSIPFFNNWDEYSSCRAHWSYTGAGFLPTQVTTVGPNRYKKITATFTFIYLRDLEENGGHREREILKNAKTWDYFQTNTPGNYYEIFTEADNDGHMDSAVFHNGQWLN